MAAADEDKDDPRLGQVLQGRYRVISRLAAGGMGTVYRGERIQLGRAVAIKFLHSSFAAEKEFLRRFEVEARAMSRLSHPHCVSVIDFGVEGAPYMVMDFVHGETLRTILDRGPVHATRAVNILRQILAGLAHAHGQGIVHRDVKPANIILGEATGTGDHARILDFGLAKLRDSAAASDQSLASMAVGTPSYMSPEQIRGEKVDGRSDVYAAAVLLFELISGKKMFTADETFEILKMHLEKRPPTFAEAAPEAEVSSELQAVMQRALEKKPEARYQTAAEFAEALDAVPEARAIRRPSTQTPAQAPPLPAPAPVPTTAAPTLPGKGKGMALAVTEPNEEPSLAALAAAATMPASPEMLDSLPRPPRLKTAPPPAAPRVPSHTDVSEVEPVASGGGGARTIGFLALLVAGAGAGWWYMHQREDESARTAAAGKRSVSQPVRPDAARVETQAGERPEELIVPALPSPDASEPPAPPDATAALAPIDSSPPDAAAEEEEELEMATDAPPSEVVPPEEREDPIAPVPEAATTPEAQVDPPQAKPTAPANLPAVELNADLVNSLIKAGKLREAEQALVALKKKYPKNAYYPYLLGNLYFDKMWWTDGMEQYQIAIRNNRGYRWRAVLIKNVIHALGTNKTRSKAATLLRYTIGSAGLPYLRSAAKHDPNKNIRERSAWLVKVLAPSKGGGGRRRRGRF
jgi:serine/threonine-protein kinase